MNLFYCKCVNNLELVILREHQVQTVDPPVAVRNINGSGKKRFKSSFRSYADLVYFLSVFNKRAEEFIFVIIQSAVCNGRYVTQRAQLRNKDVYIIIIEIDERRKIKSITVRSAFPSGNNFEF